MEQYEAIRRDHRMENLSVRQLAKKHKVHRRTVREALAAPNPPKFKIAKRGAPVLDPWRATIKEWLSADLRIPIKQRHTARWVWQRLVDEHGAVISESTVRIYVAQLRAEMSLNVAHVPIVQDHAPGDEAEADSRMANI